MTSLRMLFAARIGFGVLVLGTFVYNVVSRSGHAGFDLANVVSYFTEQSNVHGGIILLAAAARMRRAAPGSAALDWLLDPPHTRLALRQTMPWLAYPLAFVAYTLLRGPIAGWYPYPFLALTRPGGYGRVLLACVIITAGMVCLTVAITWAGNKLGARRRAS